MDKNTITGLLLISLIFVGFSWFNTSTPEVQNPTQHNQAIANEPTLQTRPNQVQLIDTLGSDSITSAHTPSYLIARPERTLTLKNSKLTVDISTIGGAPTQVVLHNYLDQNKQPLHLFRRGDARFNLPLRTLKNTIVDTEHLAFEVASATDSTLHLRLPIGQDGSLNFLYSLKEGDYRLGFSIVGDKLEELLPIDTSLQSLEWNLKMPQQEQSWKFEGQYSSIYYYSRGGSVDDLSSNKKDEAKLTEALRWVAFKDKYFSSVLINHSSTFDHSNIAIEALPEGSGYVRACTLSTSFPFSLRQGAKADFTYFFGPNDYDLLCSYDESVSADEQLHLDHLVYLGFSLFRWLNRWLIIPVVSFLSSYINNWGLIILLLTLFIKLLLSPFTFKSYISQAKMKVLKPQVDVINQKYEGKTDQESMLKKQQETMALYSSAGASPLSGCLPTLLQMPFLIALYMYFPTSILLRGESFLWAEDLSTYDPIISWDFHIPLLSGFMGNHISLFCLLMAIVNIIYNKYMMSQSSAGSDAMPGMKYMPYMMTIMFFFMFNQNASGLSYYYFVSTLITIIQYLAFRYTLNEDKLLAQLEANKQKPRKKGRWAKMLEEAQKQQQAQQKAREKSKR